MTERPTSAPRDSRGASAFLADFYSDTGAYVAVWCRIAALAWSATAAVTFALAPFFGWSFAIAGALAVVFSAAHVWVGFFYLANPEWKDGPTDVDA